MINILPSIHDVMPSTLDKVSAIVDLLPPACRHTLTLLVVPGKDWQSKQLTLLRRWHQSGIQLAGHGWQHECRQIRGIHHLLHASLLSRRAAEHLSESPDYLFELLHRCHAWFGSNGLPDPDFYVPPAWAQGALTTQHFKSIPFRYFENTTGIYDSVRDRFVWLPLAGYEADNWLRQHFLSVWNPLNYRLASPGHPLRLGIHPTDFELRLGSKLKQLLTVQHQYCSYRDLFTGSPQLT
jgi:predicted deacetylase